MYFKIVESEHCIQYSDWSFVEYKYKNRTWKFYEP
jgi:hypothetical protein